MIRQKGMLLALLIAGVVMLFSVAASAQSLTTLGEARITGKVFIKSADGKWMPAPTTYPILENTVIRTGNGSATLYFEDGSRVSLPGMTEATIGGESGSYQVNLLKGGLTFNMISPASLSVTTPAGEVSSNKSGVVRGATAGVISICAQGTEVKSNSGTLTLNVSGAEPRVVSQGQSAFVGAGGRFYANETCGEGVAAAGPAAVSSGQPVWPAYAALLAYGGGEAYAVKEGFSGPSGFASPSSPGSRRVK